MCPEALDALGPYLKKLDEYSKQMNPQSEIALSALNRTANRHLQNEL